jgi:hypothetical protein
VPEETKTLTPPRLDEKALRRETFVEGEPVVLADGQTWELRRPVVRFARANNDVGVRRVLKLVGDDSFESLCAAYEACEPGLDLVRRELALGEAVLLANYDLTLDQVTQLLQFGYDDRDADGSRVRDDVLGVVTGRGKKLSAGGAG